EPSNHKVRANVWLLTGKDPDTVEEQEVVLTGFAHQAEAPWVDGVEPTTTVNATATEVTVGQSVTFTATVEGSPPFTYSWAKDGVLLGQTGTTLVIDSAEMTDSGSYTCTAANLFGQDESSPIVLTVSIPDPVILLQPISQVKNPGTDVTFQVTATGGLAPLGYQWYKKVGESSTVIAGATSPTLTLNGISQADEAGYFCRVANAVGPVKVSRVAKPS
ncbi:MAG: immunoglobulin domain-containing protein, partial [Candidatus Buchananbacteria bacterium]